MDLGTSFDAPTAVALAVAVSLMAVAFMLSFRLIDGVEGTWPLAAVIYVSWPAGLLAFALAVYVGGSVGVTAFLAHAAISLGIIAGDLITDKLNVRKWRSHEH